MTVLQGKSNRFLIKILLTGIILFLVSCNLKTSNYYLSRAEKLEAESRYVEANVFLDKAIALNPKNIHALLSRGANYSMLGDYVSAIRNYSMVIEIDSTNTLAHFNRGLNKQRLGNYHNAIENFNRAIRTKGSENMWMEWSNNFLINSGEFDVPMEEIRLERGFARYNSDSLRVAMEDFFFSISRNHELSLNHYMIGMIYLRYDMIEEACKALNQSKIYGNTDAQELIDKYCRI
jgi:tetratricopeptide (TPR) repeat protein